MQTKQTYRTLAATELHPPLEKMFDKDESLLAGSASDLLRWMKVALRRHFGQ
jgi:hypothetical protein